MTYNSINNNLITNNDSSFNTDTPSEVSISSLDGRLWRCISKTENPLGGFLYRFKPREDITDFQEENLKGYPAVEPTPEDMLPWQLSPLDKLGFAWNNETLQVPDPIAVQQLWNKLRNEELSAEAPLLPTLNLTQSSNDLETDEDFIQFFLSDQIVISRGKEFLHDTMLHLAPTLILMHSNQSCYEQYRQHLINTCKNIYEQIQYAKKIIQENPNLIDLTNDDITKLVFTLAVIVDNLTAYAGKTSIDTQVILTRMEELWHISPSDDDPNLFTYIHNRFGDAYFTGKSFSETWEKVMQLNTAT